MQWRAGIGNFYRHAYPLNKMNKNCCHSTLISGFYGRFFSIFFFCENVLLFHGDIEANPGPNKKYKFFTCCHWNVNSLTAHNMLKFSSIAAYNSIHKYHFILVKHN